MCCTVDCIVGGTRVIEYSENFRITSLSVMYRVFNCMLQSKVGKNNKKLFKYNTIK